MKGATVRSRVINLSLRVKLVSLMVFMVAVLALSLLAFMPHYMEAQARRLVESRATSVANLLASAIAPAVEFEHRPRMLEKLEELRSVQGAVFARVYRYDGWPLAEWGEPGAPELDLNLKLDEKPELVGDRLHVVVRVPSKLGDAGRLLIGFTLAELQRERGVAFRLVISTCAFIFLVGVAFSLFVGALLVQPIQRLTKVADKITAGELPATTGLDLGRQDEVGKLSASLDQMIRKLRQSQEQLIQSGKMAAVGTLVAGLSHELNNPIGVISGYVQSLLKRTPEGAPTRQPLVAIDRQANRCAQLVRALLDFSRQKPSVRERTAIETLVEKVLTLAASQARRQSVSLVLEPITGKLPMITVCAQEIESALLNLVSNSMDATPQGGTVALTAKCLQRDNRPGIELAVRDTGTGIPPEVLPHIFDPFFTTKPPGKGTGLGLSLTKQIVTSHEGRIDIESAVDAGTTIRLWIPERVNQNIQPAGVAA